MYIYIYIHIYIDIIYRYYIDIACPGSRLATHPPLASLRTTNPTPSPPFIVQVRGARTHAAARGARLCGGQVGAACWCKRRMKCESFSDEKRLAEESGLAGPSSRSITLSPQADSSATNTHRFSYTHTAPAIYLASWIL